MTVDQPENAKVQLTVTFNGAGAQSLTFNTKRLKPLTRVFSTFCEKFNLDENTLKFLHNGHRIRADQTPEELGMEEQDEIDVMAAQQGGHGFQS